MTSDFLKQKSAPVSSGSAEHDDSQPSCSSGFQSPEAATPIMMAQVETYASNLDHYKSLPDMEGDLGLSSAHCLEIEALGHILSETVGESGWKMERAAALHLPAAFDLPSLSWTTLWGFADTLINRLQAYLMRYSELSTWNLHAQLLPAIKNRLPSILIPLHLPSYCEENCSFYTIIDGVCVSINPRQLQQWLCQQQSQLISSECLANLPDYVERLYSLLGNDKELCALFSCVKLFLRFDPSDMDFAKGDAGASTSAGASHNDRLASNLSAEVFERFENHLFELCSLLCVKFPQDFGERFRMLLNLLSWSQTFDQSLSLLINSVMLAPAKV